MTLNIGAQKCPPFAVQIIDAIRAAMSNGGTGICGPHEGGPQGKDTGRDERFDDVFYSSTLGFGEKTGDAEDR